jgi:hypothetical protein
VACWNAPNASWLRRLFPPDDQVAWEKGHGRLDRRRLKRVPVTPEEIGLCGCWQVIAVRRERLELGAKASPPDDVIAYYATSTVTDQYDDQELLAAITGHWDAVENGTHYRRDVTFREDACAVSQRGVVQVLATLRNLALGLELALERGATTSSSATSTCRQMTFATALAWLRR